MKVQDFIPLNGFMLVEPIVEMTSSSGIILQTESSNKLPSTGRVLKATSETLQGAEVLFNQYSGALVKLEEKEYHILKETEIYGYSKQ